MPHRLATVAVLACGCVFAAGASAAQAPSWAAPQIQEVTQVGVLGDSASSFAPQATLTQAQLESAIAATYALQHPVAPPPTPAAVTLASSIGPGATVGGTVSVVLGVAGAGVDHVDFALDGTGVETTRLAPYTLTVDTRTLEDGVHSLAANVAFVGGGYAIATWQVTVANAPGSVPTPLGALVALPIAKLSLPAEPTATPDAMPAAAPKLYRATAPVAPVSMKKLDAALVGYLGLGSAAREIQATLTGAGLAPAPNTGTEAVARMLGLRVNHPASQDSLELLPLQAATRAEAAYSFAQLLHLDDGALQAVQQAADTFTLPQLTPWQQRILTTAIHYVGYPYVWGGTSPTKETLFGVHSVGGFDCSGFVWRVYKLTPYPDEGSLAAILRGRTTYQMSGEVPRAERIAAADLQPGDVMFFGAKGAKSRPSLVDHAALYLGNGWLVQSSDEGVTLVPFTGWYAKTFAWGRRPLAEAGLGA